MGTRKTPLPPPAPKRGLKSKTNEGVPLGYNGKPSIPTGYEQFKNTWQVSFRSGVPRILECPEQLALGAAAYFQWCDDNPIEEHAFIGNAAKEVTIRKRRAYTWQGLGLFMGVRDWKRYKTEFEEYFDVIGMINNAIYDQHFTNAAVKIFDPAFIAKALGLVEKSETQSDVNVKSVKVEVVTTGAKFPDNEDDVV